MISHTNKQITTYRLLDATILAADIAPDAVTTEKIIDAAVTGAKLPDDAVGYFETAAEVVAAHDSGSPLELLAADASNDRLVMVQAIATILAEGAPEWDVGSQTLDTQAVFADIGGGVWVAGERWTGFCLLPANQRLDCTLTTGGTAGAIKFRVVVMIPKVQTDQIADSAVTAPKMAGSRFITIPVLGDWDVDGDQAETNGGGLICGGEVGDVTPTPAAAALCKVSDYGGGTPTYANLAASDSLAGWTNAYQLTADLANEEIGDFVAFGHPTLPFCEIALDIATPGVCAIASFIWEYSQGATNWNTLAVIDNTDLANQDGEQSFEQSGAIHFIPPTDWDKETIDGQEAYWIRCRVIAEQITTTPLTNSEQHSIVTPTDGPRIPYACTLGRMRAIDAAATIHTTADVIFFIMNFTKGVNSAALTWIQDRRNEVWDNIDVACDTNDVIGVVVTQGDGAAEVTNAILEIEAR